MSSLPTPQRPRSAPPIATALLLGVLCGLAAAGGLRADPPAADGNATTPPSASTPPGGPQVSKEEQEPTTVFDHGDGRLWVAGQVNFVYQEHGSFHADYSGPNSLQARSENALSRLLTLYTGYRLPAGAEILVDVESAGGRGISEALGLAGFTNLDVVRNPTLGDSPYLARALFHQTFALGAEREPNDRSPISSATEVAARRFDVWVGKLSTVDFFDLNSVGSDSHLQFLNWTVDNNGAYDYAADTRGYTYGLVGELHESLFGLRAGLMTMPREANGILIDPRLERARGQNLEAELRPSFGGRKGVVRLLGFRNVADMGSYREAIDAFLAGRTAVPDIVASRQQGRTKTGYGLNVEQEVTDALRVFGRWGGNDGHNESFAYTEVDGTVELGADLRLRHERHKIGIALVANRISELHRTYLALGGLGFLLGDGRLRYGQEQIVESYYTLRLWRGISVSVDLQHITNPGYNRDRGPVLVGTGRLHIDF